MNFVIGQDAVPKNNAVKTNATSRWSRTGESIFYGDDGEGDWNDDESGEMMMHTGSTKVQHTLTMILRRRLKMPTLSSMMRKLSTMRS